DYLPGDARQQDRSSDGGAMILGRRRLSRTPERVSLTFGRVLNRDQLLRVRRFWVEDTARGSWMFWMRDPVLDGVPMDLLTADGEPILVSAYWLCRFVPDQPPRERAWGAGFQISFQIYVMPR